MRAIGSRTVPPSRAVTRARSSAAARRLNVNISNCSTGQPGSNPRDRCLDERGRLARSRPGEHEQRTTRVLDNQPLARVQLGRPPRRRRRRPDQPVAGDVHADIPACRHDSFCTRARGPVDNPRWATISTR